MEDGTKQLKAELRASEAARRLTAKLLDKEDSKSQRLTAALENLPLPPTAGGIKVDAGALKDWYKDARPIIKRVVAVVGKIPGWGMKIGLVLSLLLSIADKWADAQD